MTEAPPVPTDIAALRSADAVRQRCEVLHAAALEDRLAHFRVNEDSVPAMLEAVADQVVRSYPEGEIPIHGRLNHLRTPSFDAASVVLSDAGESLIDFVVVSVLLDAGAGAAWVFSDPRAGRVGRSEGLAFASFRALEAGVFSSARRPWSIDVDGLVEVADSTLAAAMQHSEGLNPIAGFEGRAELVRSLGRLLAGHGCGSVSELMQRAGVVADRVDLHDVLVFVLNHLADLWPGRIVLGGHNLGDTWAHPLAGGTGRTAGLVPFHKLSQWLTYSLVEPLRHLGCEVTGIGRLTGLAEYRNGGMLLETGVLELKEAPPTHPVRPADQLVVEWRALTVALLDRVVGEIEPHLPASHKGLGAGEILEAGTWPLGRRLAHERSPDGDPPIRIESDGTVF